MKVKSKTFIKEHQNENFINDVKVKENIVARMNVSNAV